MKLPTVTRTIDVTVIQAEISGTGRSSTKTRVFHLPGKYKSQESSVNALRNKLADGYTICHVDYVIRKRVKCTMPLDAFYSCSSHEELC